MGDAGVRIANSIVSARPVLRTDSKEEQDVTNVQQKDRCECGALVETSWLQLLRLAG
jgi:hypothetical protein